MTNLTNIYFWNPAKQEIADLKTIREQNPNASIPEGADISVLGWFVLEETDAPSYNVLTQSVSWVVRSKQSPKGPVYYREYSVVDLPQEIVNDNLSEHMNRQKATFLQTAQKKLDDFAKERGYDDIKSAVGYAASTIPSFRAEAEICIRKRDEMWSALYAVLEKVQSNQIPIPKDFTEIEQYLPVLEWN